MRSVVYTADPLTGFRAPARTLGTPMLTYTILSFLLELDTEMWGVLA